MCNLYRMDSGAAELVKMFGSLAHSLPNLPAYPAIYPGREAPIIRCTEAGERLLDKVIWGVPPPAAGTRPVTNVRNLASPFWRSMLASPAQRCLVPVSAFCEWTGAPGAKRKVWFRRTDTDLFAFAGVWRQTAEGPRMAFLTCEPNALVAPIHPKAMPVVLREEDHRIWLSGEASEAISLAKPFDAGRMEIVQSQLA